MPPINIVMNDPTNKIRVPKQKYPNPVQGNLPSLQKLANQRQKLEPWAKTNGQSIVAWLGIGIMVCWKNATETK